MSGRTIEDLRGLVNKNALFIAAVFLTLLLALITLYPVLHSGYSGDDSFESLAKGFIIEKNTSLPEYTYDMAVQTAQKFGRTFVIQFYYYPIFYFTDLHSYKLLIVLSVILDILSFGYFIKLLSRSDMLALLAMLIMPLFFQQRLFHDPILAYHLLQQLLILSSLWSWIFLYHFLERGKKIDLAVSLVLYAISLGMYEATFPFFMISAAMIFLYGKRQGLNRKLGLSAAYAALSAVFICLSLLIRISVKLPITGDSQSYRYSINTNVFAYLGMLAKQVVAAFPLSYFFFDPNAIFSRSPMVIAGGLSLTALVIFLGTLAIFYVVSRGYAKPEGDRPYMPWRLLIIGVLLLVLPEVLVSASPEYQRYIVPGIAYIPVYLSYFGAAMIALSLIWALYRLINEKSPKYAMAAVLILAVLVSGVSTLNYMSNVITIDHSNQFWLYPRSVIEDGLNHGLMGNVPENSTLITGTNYPWDQSAFYLLGSGKQLKYVASTRDLIYMGFGRLDPSRLPAGSRVDGGPGLYRFTGNDSVYYLAYDSYADGQGYAILGRADSLSAPQGTVRNVTGHDLYIYVRTAHGLQPNVQQQIARQLTVSGIYGNSSGNDTSARAFTAVVGQSQVAASGDGWKLIHIIANNGELDLDSVNVKIST